MITIPINYNARYAIEEYCKVNIGPRKYYLHNKVGGIGWSINVSSTVWLLECDEKHAVVIALKYGVDNG